MLLAVVSHAIYSQRWKVFDRFSSKVSTLWNQWELRLLVLLSLALQIGLIVKGGRRKYAGAAPFLTFMVWSMYLLSESVMSTALSVLTTRERYPTTGSPNNKLAPFWASFLLLHLGSPETITAYALEDNELWIRKSLDMALRLAIVVYVSWNAREGTWISYLTVPMFFVGAIKYIERILVLRVASSKKFREEIMTTGDPGPNYAKFMAEFSLRKAEGYRVKAEEVKESVSTSIDRYYAMDDDQVLDSRAVLQKAKSLFANFKRLFVDLILSFHDRDSSRLLFQRLTPTKAFTIIETELSLAYDVFFTKAPLLYRPKGCVLRAVTFSLSLAVLVLFSSLVVTQNHTHKRVDLFITFVLILGAIATEVYSFALFLSSDWAYLWLTKHPFLKISRGVSHFRILKKPRWSNSMSQYDFLAFCLAKPPKCATIQKIIAVDEWIAMRRNQRNVQAPPSLKSLIFYHFLDKSMAEEKPSELCKFRGDYTLKRYGLERDSLILNSVQVEFDNSILIWHIATDLCYYSTGALGDPNREASKLMSDYMLYLLVLCPFMLPVGIGMIRLYDSVAEAKEFFKERSGGRDCTAKEVHEMLLEVNTEVPPAKVKGDRSKSVVFEACRLAAALRQRWDGVADMWVVISQVWVEMMGYAAGRCRGFQHTQQLSTGGELLTHVWLLMAHFGITEQFQISQGHARATLVAD